MLTWSIVKIIVFNGDGFALRYKKTTYSGTDPNTKQLEMEEVKNVNITAKHSDFDEA